MQEIPYNPGMSEQVKQALVSAMEKKGENFASLSKAVGRNHAYLQQFVTRGSPTKLPEDVRRELARILEIDESTLREPSFADIAPVQYRPPPEILGERDLKVFSAVEGGPGHMVVSTDNLVDVVPRPWYMREVRDGFGVLVVGESMIPAFEPGDIAVVNPRLPAIRGKDVILIGDEEHGEFKASIKRLEGSDAKMWHLRQFNPPRGQKQELSWPKRDWPKALRVVGKYNGG